MLALPYDYHPEWEHLSARDITSDGVLLAHGTRLSTGQSTDLLLLPVDIAVDANRDGVIKFGGNYDDPAVAGKPQDKTEETKPFRFWCNDDDDGTGDGEDDPDSSEKDSGDNEIKSLRDLEDFTRLHLYVGGLQDAVRDGSLQLGLEWRNTDGTTPEINVYRAAEPDGGTKYITNDDGNGGGNEYYAALQQATPFKTAMGVVDGSGGFKFPSDFWQSTGSGIPAFGEDHPTRYVLFEGVTEGKGQLVLTLWKGGERIGEGAGVWIDLMNIKKMYVRAKAWNELTNSEQFNDYPHDDLSNQPDMQVGWVADPNGNPFEPPPDENKELIVFVHGINRPGLNEPDRIYDNWTTTSETVLKRLWWAGYKGRFASFKWPALTPGPQAFPPDPAPLAFNDSEFRAWKSGRGLQGFVDSFPNDYKKNLYSFSQGAPVCGSALTVYGLTVDNYVMSQAAMAAGSYDTSTHVNNYQDFLDAEDDRPTPDTAADLGYRGYLANLNVTGDVVSFYNTFDYALKTGSEFGQQLNWEGNQLDYKPNKLGTVKTYAYDPGSPANPYPVGSRCFLRDSPLGMFRERAVLDIHESMSFVARPRSEAAGANTSVSGSIDHLYDVGPGSECDFGEASADHGGQFSRNMQHLWPYYRELGTRLRVFAPQQ